MNIFDQIIVQRLSKRHLRKQATPAGVSTAAGNLAGLPSVTRSPDSSDPKAETSPDVSGWTRWRKTGARPCLIAFLLLVCGSLAGCKTSVEIGGDSDGLATTDALAPSFSWQERTLAAQDEIPVRELSSYLDPETVDFLKHLRFNALVKLDTNFTRKGLTIREVEQYYPSEYHVQRAKALLPQLKLNDANTGSHIPPSITVWVVFYQTKGLDFAILIPREPPETNRLWNSGLVDSLLLAYFNDYSREFFQKRLKSYKVEWQTVSATSRRMPMDMVFD